MKRISEALPATLEWTHPPLEQGHYELRCATQLLATLKFPSGLGSRLHGSLAIGTCAEAGWEFNELAARVPRRIEIGSSGVFVGKTGILELRSYRRYRWQALSLSQWTFCGEHDRDYVLFTRSYEKALQMLDRLARVDVAHGASKLPDLELLVVLGALLLVLKLRDGDDLTEVARRYGRRDADDAGGDAANGHEAGDTPDLELD